MNILKQFPTLKIARPLFYNWPIGLRFEIGPSNLGVWDSSKNGVLNEKYFSQALERAIQLFESIFSFHDECTVIYQQFSDGRQKIRKSNFLFRQIENIDEGKVKFKNIRNIYNLNYKSHCWRRVTISNILTSHINYKNILAALINTDFPPRRPRTYGEYFFIHNAKDIILNLYDDRGMDVIATDVGALQELYKKYNGWILDYDKPHIEKIFS